MGVTPVFVVCVCVGVRCVNEDLVCGSVGVWECGRVLCWCSCCSIALGVPCCKKRRLAMVAWVVNAIGGLLPLLLLLQ